ncbi:MAG: DMT family transporter [Hyphomicrobiales bacterium]|nr:DMT family transporter [Hyphomicrobiales bacterium]
MDPKLPFVLLALLGGAALPVQIGINGSLRQIIGSAMQAATISFSVGALAGLIASILMREGTPSLEKLGQSAPWMWIGGFFGVFYVWTTIVTGPKLGALLAVSLVIAGQLTVSLALDHFGALGFPQSSISPLKLFGLGCVIFGVLVIGYAKQG